MSDLSRNNYRDLNGDDFNLERLLAVSHMVSYSTREIADLAVEEAVKITESTIGYLAFLNEEEDILTMHAWSKTAMDSCNIIDKPIVYSLESTGLWGEAVRQRKPVITNDYTLPCSYKKGFPDGHVPVLRHMNIPVFDGEKIVLIAGVGNKEKEYNDKDVKLLTILMDSIWRLLQKKKMEEELEKINKELEIRILNRTKELENSEKFLINIIENIPSMVFIKDAKELKYILFNRAGEELLGYKKQEIIGKNDYDFFSKEIADSSMKKDREILIGGKVINIPEEKINTRYKGSKIISTKKIPLFGENGTPQYLLGVSNDISMEMKIQEALKESEDQLYSIVKTAMDAIISVDFYGNIIFWNYGAENIFYYLSEEAVGQSLDIIIPSYLRKDGENVLYTVVSSGTTVGQRSEMIGLRKDETEFPMEISVGTWHSGGNRFFTIIIRDISERKNLEEKLLREKELLESAQKELKATQSAILQREKMASIGQLAAGVAHEINNPIGFVSGNIRAMSKYVNKFIEYIEAQNEVIETVPDNSLIERLREKKKKLKLDYIINDIKELINETLDGTERVTRIVKDLKSFSRVDEAEYKEADINECIESTVNIVWNELKYKASITKEYGNISRTRCYPQQLNQVFMNLLINASHAIDNKGEIKINTWEKDNFIFISISDTGCGIPPEIVNRIFEPFFTTKEVGKGTGLGLSITYDIIKKHNGEINVQSTPGKGTNFTIKMPIVR